MTRPLRLQFPGAVYHLTVLNPVRANMVKRVEDWPWSSYLVTAGKATAADWLETDWVVKQLGEETAAARKAYRRFVQAGEEGASPWEKLRSQIYLGGDDFLARMAKLATEQGKDGAPKRHRQSARPDAQAVLRAVTQTFRVITDAVQNRGLQPASRAWVYLLRRAANLGLLKTAARAGVSPVPDFTDSTGN